MSYARKTCVVVCAMVAMLALAPQAQATLIAWYNMEQSASPLVDQAGGQTAVTNGGGGDLYQQAGVPAGTYGALTLANTTGYAVGMSNTATQWNLSVADSAELNLTNNFTAMAWIYLPATPTASDDQAKGIIGLGTAWIGQGWDLGVRHAAGKEGISFTMAGQADYLSGDVIDWTGGAWHHVAATKSSTGGINLYLDGNLSKTYSGATGNVTAMDASHYMSIGRMFNDARTSTIGERVDEIRVYDTVLTQTEISAAAIEGVPEPSTLALLVTGLLGLLAYAWRKRK